MNRFIFAAASIAALAGPAIPAAERQLAPRLAMSETRAVPAGEAGYSRGPAMAFSPSTGSGQGGGRYLLVYQDGYNGLGGDSNILGLLLDAKGEPVGKPIAICSAKGAQDNPAFAEKVIPRVPMRRWGEPKDFGGVAVYLTSDASSYHTGDAFVIDGAYSIF